MGESIPSSQMTFKGKCVVGQRGRSLRAQRCPIANGGVDPPSATVRVCGVCTISPISFVSFKEASRAGLNFLGGQQQVEVAKSKGCLNTAARCGWVVGGGAWEH